MTNLHSFIDVNLLYECLDALNKKGAAGVDGQSWNDYNEQRDERVPQLLEQFKSGRYRAPAIRRTYIPKGDGKQRPLGSANGGGQGTANGSDQSVNPDL
ncbi:MAG: hypothetical protein U5K69_09015 [Balneolaceae bacterium]|nr:hypothetical protein [Balneolaceae bacterium]